MGRRLRTPAILVFLVLSIVVQGGVSGPVAAGTALVAGAVLAWQRFPLAALALATSVSLLRDPSTVPMLGAVAVCFAAGRRLESVGPPQIVFAVVAVAGLPVAAANGTPSDAINVVLTEFLVCALPWWAGSWWRQRAELARAGWERAARMELLAEQARLHERTRIARDMHDSLGHELSLMALLAGGLEVARDLPEEHHETAVRLRAGAVSATHRLHEIIGVLGAEPGPAALEPSGADVSSLVTRAREAGVTVTLTGSPHPGNRHAVYRVVQEALTNAIKHAPGAAVTITLTDSSASVINTRPRHRPDPAGSGSGLISLAERVRLAGGTLRTGPLPDGGFEVHAGLPRTPGSPAPPPTRRTYEEHLRGELLRGARLPAVLGAGAVVVLLGAYVLTAVTTSLGPDVYAGLTPGTPRTAIALPHSYIRTPPPVLTEPPVPAHARCEYYRLGLFDLSDSLYRLCFADGALITKDLLTR
ncbi:sensor histidine kinase [Catenuloplanes japonicus]|uniref:sensor histidine kinase n=1 Tax=Catenuloplanes japonicus TaxID=33876 RepID=UPI00052557F0|nr:histidine kinase [Catenuloplanes japonicus]